jgi:hypothetical protein
MTADLGSALLRTFQLSARMPARRVRELHDGLEELWEDVAGSPPGELQEDLELLRKRFFDPVAQGKRLREELVALPPRPAAIGLPEPLRMVVDDERAVITPEGRTAIELLNAPIGDVATIELDEALAADLELTLLDHYRRWARHRIKQVVDLLGDEALRPPVIGVLLTLLVNRSVGRSRAVLRYLEGPERDAIDEAFRAPVGRFADAIDPRQRRSLAKERLISGWTLHEVTRRYPRAIRIEEGNSVSRVYIAEGAERVLLDAVARALARKHVGLTTAGNAFDGLVESLRDQGPTLAGYGMFFERPGDTARLRDDLLEALRERQLELQQA